MSELSDIELAAGIARGSLLGFALGMLPTYETPHHIELIANKLQDLEERKLKRLMVFMPPRHGKSYLISQFFPAWYLGRNPKHEIIFASYSQDIASGFGRRVRNLMSEPMYKHFFPGTVLSEDSNAVNRFNTTASGAYYGAGAGGPLTSRGANLIVIDDIHKNREEANSETMQKKIHEWWGSTLYTRLMPDGVIVLVQTRWAEADLPGTILDEQGDQWEVLSLPAINAKNEALWPDRYPIDTLLDIKKTIGTQDFEALYQQAPFTLEGNIIKRDWLREYESVPEDLDEEIITADLSYKEGTDTDFTVIQAWGRKGANCYLLDMIRKRMGFPDQIAAIREMAKRHPDAWGKYIEQHANGQAVIDMLKNELMGLIPVKPMTSKEARLAAVSPSFEAGNVYLPKFASWTPDVIHELTAFPNAKHDDIVDACVYAVSQFSAAHSSFDKITALARR